MQQPTFLNLKYTYKKPGTEVWVLNTDDIPLDKALIKDNQIVHIPPRMPEVIINIRVLNGI